MREGTITTLGLGRAEAFAYRHRLAITIAVVCTSIATCAILAAVAGPRAVSAVSRHLVWWTLPAILMAHALAYAGYVVAHHQVLSHPSSRSMSWKRGAQLVMAGFGAWSTVTGFAMDRHALEWQGTPSAEARGSARVLGLLELLLLAPAAWLSALLLVGAAHVGVGQTWPWIVGVPAAALAAVAIARRGRDLRASIGVFAQVRDRLAAALTDTWTTVRHPRQSLPAIVALGIYWAGDIVALWAALQFASASIAPARLVVAYANGYVLTRRSLPLAGVVVIEAALAVSLVWLGIPLASAAIAVLVYRLSDFSLTVGGSLLAAATFERTLNETGRWPALDR